MSQPSPLHDPLPRTIADRAGGRTTASPERSTIRSEEQYDAIIVGAGFSGVHQLFQLRRLGLRCTVIEAGSDFGGVWHWNRYPGARTDCHVPVYELSLPEIWKEWTWTEMFPGWQELQAYFAYVGDKLDLRPYCRFDTVVKRAHWDDRLHLWHVTAEGKEGVYQASARYLTLCTGFASKPYIPNIKGQETFKGPCCHTSRWPKEDIETTGKRVGIIGTGSSGLQVIQEIGPQVGHLTVFQRTPNMAMPMGQCSMSKQMQDHLKPLYEDMFKKLKTTPSGLLYEAIPRPLLADNEKVREANLERVWNSGGFSFTLANYQDVPLNKESNDVIYAFWRKKVSERIKDPRKRALLAPEVAPHPLGSKRPCLEQTFYEVFNQDNVDLVDTNATPILEIYENGVRTVEREYEFDVLVFATGFDTYGGYNSIDLRGLDGKTIQDHWADGATTHLGLTIDDFPNLFLVYGPHGPTAFSNGPTSIQMQGEWIVQTITYLRERNVTKFTPTRQAALAFKKRVDELCDATLLPYAPTSWYMNGHIPGRKREIHSYAGGLVAYKQEIMSEMEQGYPGFRMESLQSKPKEVA